MIVSFRDKRTEHLAAGERVREFSGFSRQAEMRLDRLDAAMSLGDLAAFRGNRLEALKGNRAGQYSIRINDQWRICLNGRTGRRVRSMSRLWTITREQEDGSKRNSSG
jgi:proteic killer suppression protein